VSAGRRNVEDCGTQETRLARRKTVLLVRSGHVVGAAGLYSILMDMWDVRIVATVVKAEQAIEAACMYRPSHVLVGANEIDDVCHGWLVELKRVRPETKLIVCTDVLEQEMQLRLGRIPIDGYLAWRHVSADNLRRGMELAEEGIRFSSGTAVDELLAARTEVVAVALTGIERIIIGGFDAALNESQIAAVESVGPRTVRRGVNSLKAKLGVRTLYWLGRMVERQRLDE